MKSKINKIITDHTLVETCIKLTPFLKRQFIRYSEEKGKNKINRTSLSHGIRLAGVALSKKYGVKKPELLCDNYQ